MYVLELTNLSQSTINISSDSMHPLAGLHLSRHQSLQQTSSLRATLIVQIPQEPQESWAIVWAIQVLDPLPPHMLSKISSLPIELWLIALKHCLRVFIFVVYGLMMSDHL